MMATENAQQRQARTDETTIRVTVYGAHDNVKKWTLPLALVKHHANYFQDYHAQEGQRTKASVFDHEPRIFELFVDYIHNNQHRLKDDPNDDENPKYAIYFPTEDEDGLPDESWVRDLAKAWVLGDHLESRSFKDYCMSILFHIYFRAQGPTERPIGVQTITFVWARTEPNCVLRKFLINVLIRNWHKPLVVVCREKTRSIWEGLWEEHADLRNILYALNRAEADHDESHGDLMSYLSWQDDYSA